MVDHQRENLDDQLRKLVRRLDDYSESGDPTEVLADSSAVLADQLIQAAVSQSGTVPLKTAFVVSRFKWTRYLLLPPPTAETDRRTALALFAALLRAAPEGVPAEARASAAGEWFRAASLDDARLDDAIAELAAAGVVPGHDRIGHLIDLREALEARWRRRGLPADLDGAVVVQRELVGAVPAGDPTGERSVFADLLRTRFEESGNDIADLDAAIGLWREIRDETPTGHPKRMMTQTNLALALNIKARLSGDTAVAGAAVEALKSAIELTPADDPRQELLRARLTEAESLHDPVSLLVNTDTVQRLRYLKRAQQAGTEASARELQNRDVVTRACIDVAYQTPPSREAKRLILTAFPGFSPSDGSAVAEGPDGPMELDDQLWHLAEAAAASAATAGDEAAALGMCLVALRLAPPDADLVPVLRFALWLSGDAADAGDKLLDVIIWLCEELLDRTTPGDAPHDTQSLLAKSLLKRHKTHHIETDLNLSIEILNKLTRSSSAEDPDRFDRFAMLADALARRFRATQKIPDIDAAVTNWQEARLVASTASDRLVASIFLGRTLRERFEVTRQDADITAAIELGRTAVAEWDPDSSDYAHALTSLALSYRSRFVRSGRPQDSDTAVELGRRAVEVATAGGGAEPYLLVDLAESLTARMGTMAPDEMIAEMAETLRESARTAATQKERDQTNLAIARFFRQDIDRSADIITAISLYRGAIAATDPTDREYAGYQSNLAVLLDAFGRINPDPGLRAPVEEPTAAVEASSIAVTTAWKGDPRRSNILRNAGVLLGVARPEGSALVQQAATDTSGPAFLRLRAARDWADAAAEAGDFASAVAAYAIAVGQLVQVSRLGRDRTHQEDQLVARPGLACDAAASAVAAGRPELALELLEQGRSVLWTGTLDLRADLTRLAEAAPGLHAEAAAVRGALDDSALSSAGQRIHLAQEWDRLVPLIRQVEGFEDFLRPPTAQHLLEAASEGPVVIINVSRWRCDALIVKSGGVTSVELPALTAEDAAGRTNTYLDSLQSAERADDVARAAVRQARSSRTMADRQAAQRAERELRDRRADSEAVLTETLAWLWNAVAGPVLTELGHHRPIEPGEPWPRVWWCPTGPLTLLPLHAAGYHDASGRAVVDRVQSSYTPTLRALIRARDTAPSQTSTNDRTLIVALADAPGQAPLESVPEELSMMSRVLTTDRTTVISGPSATREAVLTELSRHGRVHFSCHGDQTLDYPTHGGIVLYDGVLTIADVSSQPYPADFACLSACKTAVGGLDLADEAITLAAALHHVGCRHVIGTLWSVEDSSTTVAVFEDIYRGMAHGERLVPAESASAMHHAVRTQRDGNLSRPTVWTPFVHIGL